MFIPMRAIPRLCSDSPRLCFRTQFSDVLVDSVRADSEVSLSTILNNTQLSSMLEEFAEANGSGAHLQVAPIEKSV
jgi:hypothetical protein